jgi:hypothetical protein
MIFDKNQGNLANISNNINSLGLSIFNNPSQNMSNPSHPQEANSSGFGADPFAQIFPNLQSTGMDQASLTAQKQLQDLTNAYKTQLCKHHE